MRELVIPAVLTAAAAAVAEIVAVVLGWSPPLWLLVAPVVVAGVAAFLVAGRRRALRLQARRRARAQTKRRSRTGTAAGVPAAETAMAAAVPDRGGPSSVRRL